MRCVTIDVDGELRASVTTENLDVLSVSIGGAKVDDDVAHIELSGGRYPEDGESTHLIWLSDLAVRAGQTVRISVADHGATSYQGKTVKELFPGEPEVDEAEVPPKEQVIEELRQRPRVREQCTVLLRSARHTEVRAELDEREHGFGVSVLWNWVQPERVSASLHTYSLDQLLSGEGFTYHFRERLEPGDWLEVRIEA
jgi:hypothetical protein